jgi:hypothetical protein
VIEKESLNINKLEQVLIEKVEQLFRDMLKRPDAHRCLVGEAKRSSRPPRS